MRLFEHPDFEQAVLRAAERYGLSEQFIEKDYYVTEILRIVAHAFGEPRVIRGLVLGYVHEIPVASSAAAR